MSRETEREAWEGSLRGDKSRGKEKRNTRGRGGWGRKAEQKKRDANLVEGVVENEEAKRGENWEDFKENQRIKNRITSVLRESHWEGNRVWKKYSEGY